MEQPFSAAFGIRRKVIAIARDPGEIIALKNLVESAVVSISPAGQNAGNQERDYCNRVGNHVRSQGNRTFIECIWRQGDSRRSCDHNNRRSQGEENGSCVLHGSEIPHPSRHYNRTFFDGPWPTLFCYSLC